MVDTCVQCGSIVPEGTMVCKSCVDKAGLKSGDTDIQSIRVERLFGLSLRCIYRQLKKIGREKEYLSLLHNDIGMTENEIEKYVGTN